MITLAEIKPEVFILAFGGMGFVIVLLGGIFWYSWHEERRKMSFKLQKEREQTHREIAAYIAEGSISPDDGERLIHAMGKTDDHVRAVRHEAREAAQAGSDRLSESRAAHA